MASVAPLDSGTEAAATLAAVREQLATRLAGRQAACWTCC